MGTIHAAQAYLEQLPPFVKAEVVEHGAGSNPERILIAGKPFKFTIIGSHLGRPMAKGLVAEASDIAAANRIVARHGHASLLVLAPYVSPQMGRLLEENGLSYIDRLGNCHLQLGPSQVVHVRERKPSTAESGPRGLRPPGLQVEFAILEQPMKLNQSVRLLATLAEVGKSTAANTIENLTRRGFIGRSATGRHILDHGRLLDHWVAAYAGTLRPSLLIGRYRTPHADPEALEVAVEGVFTGLRWGWGGGAAAHRLIRHYRGEQTVVHVSRLPKGALATLRAVPSRDGDFIVLHGLGQELGFVAPAGVAPHVVHPLLVYAELVATPDPRAHQAAHEIRERFLTGP